MFNIPPIVSTARVKWCVRTMETITNAFPVSDGIWYRVLERQHLIETHAEEIPPLSLAGRESSESVTMVIRSAGLRQWWSNGNGALKHQSGDDLLSPQDRGGMEGRLSC
ncbi:hypothetical protein TNCV_4718261 [Trichonephila clavipes]|nr:hypothetical protein TNCV_4718261 [Trichonephila clavipes]